MEWSTEPSRVPTNIHYIMCSVVYIEGIYIGIEKKEEKHNMK